jgi:glycine/D-amino acid oxidase-like deaminating enzyme
MMRRITVIGAGIVGSLVALRLAESDGCTVTVLEAGAAGRMPGSTGHAPGFMGLLNESPLATELARRSADSYAAMSREGRRGFDRVGGIEVAVSEPALPDLRRRAALAAERGLSAKVLGSREIADRAPDLIEAGSCLGGVFYADDGTARADLITTEAREQAIRAGAQFVYDTAVSGIETDGARVNRVETASRAYQADDVVLACGIWGSKVASLADLTLPLLPVAHPYVYGPPNQTGRGTPFVRWPERHVYARHHDDRIGLGTYDHEPQAVDVATLGREAEQPWPADLFDAAVNAGLQLLPSHSRFRPEQRLNGLFLMTPDNLPLLGATKHLGGCWIAEAIWVTHAGGAAEALTDVIVGRTPHVAIDDLNPDRFDGHHEADLHGDALRLYRDIYATAS